jgi:drug/metabolite transporter (DMT)-like permease
MSRRALVLFSLMSLIWGIPYLLIRIAVADITPATLVFCRTAIGALLLLPVALLRYDIRPVLARWRWVLAFTAAELAVPWVLLGSAEQRVTSSLAALLVAAVPLIATVLAVASGDRGHMGRNGLVGLVVGLAGVAAIVGSNLGSSDLLAIVEIAIVAVGYAVGPAIMARRLGGLPAAGVMALAMATCALLYLPLAVAQRPATLPGADALLAVAILGVVCTALAFVLFWALIDEIGPVRSTVVTYVNPAVAAVLGVMILNETMTVAMLAGLALVILGSALATHRPQPAQRAVVAASSASEISERPTAA